MQEYIIGMGDVAARLKASVAARLKASRMTMDDFFLVCFIFILLTIRFDAISN